MHKIVEHNIGFQEKRNYFVLNDKMSKDEL
jgi:hypothetical protein